MPTTPSAPPPRPAVVYLVRAKVPKSSLPAYKIGMSTNLAERLYHLRRRRSPWGTAAELVDVVTIGYGSYGESLARAVEAALHAHYDTKRVPRPENATAGDAGTEWFTLSRDEVAAFHTTSARLQSVLLVDFIPGESGTSRRRRHRRQVAVR